MRPSYQLPPDRSAEFAEKIQYALDNGTWIYNFDNVGRWGAEIFGDFYFVFKEHSEPTEIKLRVSKGSNYKILHVMWVTDKKEILYPKHIVNALMEKFAATLDMDVHIN